jgi:hypothetical protein
MEQKMHTRTFLPVLLLTTASCGLCADVITINQSQALLKLSWQLSERYGYLVTYEEAPIDQENEVVRGLNAAGRTTKSAVRKPVTFHVPRAQAPGADGTSTDISGPEGILPLSKELIQPMVDDYNASGNPSKFAVSFDGTYAHILAVSHRVNGKMEDFQPILATKITMAPQPLPCYQTIDNLLAELKKMRGVDVEALLIDPNWVLRHECSIVGADLTAGEVLAQVAHEFGFGTPTGAPPVQPGREMRITWWLAHDPDSEKYYLSMAWVRDKTPTTTVAPSAPAQAEKQPVATAPAGVDVIGIRVPTPPAH